MPKISGTINLEISQSLLKTLFYRDWDKKNQKASDVKRKKAYQKFLALLDAFNVTTDDGVIKCTMELKEGQLLVNKKSVPNIIAAVVRNAISLRGMRFSG